MYIEPPSIEQLSNVISQVTGPAFLLAAEAQLLSVLMSRLDRLVDRSRDLAELSDEDAQAHRKIELPILRRRAKLVHRSIYWGVASCVVTSVLVIIAFASALMRLRHEYGAATLFVIAMALFTGALIAFAQEVRLGYSEIDANAVFMKKHRWRREPIPPRID
ncbi:DUF2721 domain-containing protein [Methylocystis parvus]|uniref:DUF2721 domain-containing protein n=1 Tax=Methylocystis parvus TaxID=134 RepID=A0A6B8LYJ2_9HYPH|nr:DUF2721 domain-containing protein [Methylocystis parvus]QGM96534.1 DUF2721 domain-containing protein [Methylocystis parvus]WBJ99614.1 DUF2721 domain-containing protein [Methylocystis parvus OBBP]